MSQDPTVDHGFSPASQPAAPSAPAKDWTVTAPNRRWWIIWTLFGSTVINYINRQTLSVLAPVITKEFHLSHTQLSKIFGSFQFAYAGMWLIGGVLLDLIGTRLGLAIAVVWWSLASAATSFANSAASFGALRFCLGIGEGVNWPGASKAVAEFFPARERSMAVAIFDSGSSVGGALAAITVPWIAMKFGWRSCFVVSGLLGFLWLAVWLAVYRRTPRSVRMVPNTNPRQWLSLLRQPKTWAIVLGRSLTDPIWWFYVFWLPQYLSDTRGFSLKQIAAFAWIPFVAADAGNFIGGFASGALIRRGVPVLLSRKIVCIFSCIPLLGAIPAAFTGNAYFSLALISFALLGYASWSTMGLTLPSDLFPPDFVGTVTGLSGLFAGLAGTLFTLLVGVLVDRFSYTPAFIAAAIVPLVATACVLLLIRKQDDPNLDRESSYPQSAA
jgi:ACS family hexuronate transporter-like MFS transporter